MNRQKLEESIIKHEGMENRSYKDTEGNWTIGVGHLQHRPTKGSITYDTILDLLDEDIDKAIEVGSKIFKKFNRYPDHIQRFIVEMSFNMGYRLRGFKKANKALKQGDIEKAEIEYRDSKWSGQVKKIRTNDMMRILRGED